MDDLKSADLTTLLAAWKSDDDLAARDQAFELAHDDLLAIARKAISRQWRLQHKVEPRELLSELYVRVADYPASWENRARFYAMVCVVMRNVLIDLAKRDRAAKRPPTALRVTDSALGRVGGEGAEVAIERLYSLLDRLASMDPRRAQVFELHDLAGVSIDDVATALGISSGTVKRDLRLARPWMRVQLESMN
ncbi:MAG: sigma-70 family RNA polymerase sigma factor [Acidobacteria bacterium]|nr:sigma-70 family RNA polymerase sigma factor [Acidobacteriota bacterium]